jgi:hypothetical protein
MISGCYTGIVAAKAVKSGDASLKNLSKNDVKRARGGIGVVEQGLREVFRARGYDVGDEWRSLEKIPDAEFEKVLVELNKKMAMTAEVGVGEFELIL